MDEEEGGSGLHGGLCFFRDSDATGDDSRRPRFRPTSSSTSTVVVEVEEDDAVEEVVVVVVEVGGEEGEGNPMGNPRCVLPSLITKRKADHTSAPWTTGETCR